MLIGLFTVSYSDGLGKNIMMRKDPLINWPPGPLGRGGHLELIIFRFFKKVRLRRAKFDNYLYWLVIAVCL